ncbi:unnamed protein product [Amoebophrya sp. A25]|nr:unnamed protein product [Amoebophrya sp. A25]|eukprot:GSA25T00010568001.1
MLRGSWSWIVVASRSSFYHFCFLCLCSWTDALDVKYSYTHHAPAMPQVGPFSIP